MISYQLFIFLPVWKTFSQLKELQAWEKIGGEAVRSSYSFENYNVWTGAGCTNEEKVASLWMCEKLWGQDQHTYSNYLCFPRCMDRVVAVFETGNFNAGYWGISSNHSECNENVTL